MGNPIGERVAALEKGVANQDARCTRTQQEIRGELWQIHALQRETLEAVATLKVKASLWGAVAGGIPVLILLAVYILSRILAG